MASGLPQRPTLYIFQQPLLHTLALSTNMVLNFVRI